MTTRHFNKRLTMAMALAMALLVSAAAASAKVAVVYLKDRSEPLKGELVRDTGDKIVLKIAGIDTPINKANVIKMEWELSLTEQYQQKRGQLKDDDYQGRYELATWVSEQHGMEGDKLAVSELQSIVEVKPDFPEAKLLLQLVKQRIYAAEHPGETDQPTPPNDNTGGVTPPTEPATKVPTLDREQVNLMKVLELDLRTKPALTIPPKAIDEFLNEYRANKLVEPYTGPGGERKFKSLKGYEQVRILFNVEARKYYKDIIVRDEPAVLADFRQTWYPTLVMRDCASCHADGQAKGLYLITHHAQREDVAYTNFLILCRTNAKEQKLIDRQTPANSLLLQYGLPRDTAAYPHPDVPNFRPYFAQGPKDPNFIKATKWISKLYPYNHDYPVDYKVPTVENK